MDKQEELARKAYDAYSEAVGGKAYDGSPLKKFDEFSDNIKAGWYAAAGAVWAAAQEGKDAGSASTSGAETGEASDSDTEKKVA